MRGTGLDPGARAHVTDRLTPEALQPVDLASLKKAEDTKPTVAPATDGPLLAPVLPQKTRVYVGMTVTTKGKNAAAAHAVVSMIDSPPAPGAPQVTYDEKTVTIAWPPIQFGLATAAANGDVLPSTLIGVSVPTVSYNVYEVSETDAAHAHAPHGKPGQGAAPCRSARRLGRAPLLRRALVRHDRRRQPRRQRVGAGVRDADRHVRAGRAAGAAGGAERRPRST